jgi:predicted 3-demethylubiquinone-9 3-methyltransferase (glyoxalase superfamily)
LNVIPQGVDAMDTILPAGPSKLIPFLTFAGQAEEAMDHYLRVFTGSERISLTRTDDRLDSVNPGQLPGKVLNGQLRIKGQPVLFMDLAPEYATPFSWASSLYVVCEDEAEFDRLFSGLSEDGRVMMGPEPVLMLRKVAWVTDRFHVTWQLVWA